MCIVKDSLLVLSTVETSHCYHLVKKQLRMKKRSPELVV